MEAEKMTFIAQLQADARLKKIPIVREDALAFIKFMARLVKAEKILEIGTAIGYFAISMAYSFPEARIDTIERDPEMVKAARLNLTASGVSDRVRLFAQDARDISLAALYKGYDMIFIDAAKAQYQKFFLKFSPLLKAGGLIVSDNVAFHGLVENPTGSKRGIKLAAKIRNYREFLKANNDYFSLIVNVGDGLALTARRN